MYVRRIFVLNVHNWRLGNMEKYILRVTFGEARCFARVLSKDQFSFAIETLYPVQGIMYSEASQGDYNKVSFFEESVLKAFKTSIIFSKFISVQSADPAKN